MYLGSNTSDIKNQKEMGDVLTKVEKNGGCQGEYLSRPGRGEMSLGMKGLRNPKQTQSSHKG